MNAILYMKYSDSRLAENCVVTQQIFAESHNRQISLVRLATLKPGLLALSGHVSVIRVLVRRSDRSASYDGTHSLEIYL